MNTFKEENLDIKLTKNNSDIDELKREMLCEIDYILDYDLGDSINEIESSIIDITKEYMKNLKKLQQQ